MKKQLMTIIVVLVNPDVVLNKKTLKHIKKSYTE